MQEISVELVKTLEGWANISYSPEVDSQVYTSGNTQVYDCLQPNKFTTAFVPTNLLDDQTITNNVDMVPLYAVAAGAYDNTAGIAHANAKRNTKTNGHNWICPRGYCVQGMFQSPASKFMLGFNMRSFKTSDGCDGGTYLGNNTITLGMSGCVGLKGANQTYRAVAIVPHRVAMRYSPGGQLVWAY